jgi:hypothetical protein
MQRPVPAPLKMLDGARDRVRRDADAAPFPRQRWAPRETAALDDIREGLCPRPAGRGLRIPVQAHRRFHLYESTSTVVRLSTPQAMATLRGRPPRRRVAGLCASDVLFASAGSRCQFTEGLKRGALGRAAPTTYAEGRATVAFQNPGLVSGERHRKENPSVRRGLNREATVVVSSLMLHHVPDPVKHRGPAEIHGVLKPAGRLAAVRCQPRSVCARGVHLAFDWDRARA